jgi:predicted  nucleic acid-binding Zn-ribbon protein
VEESQRQRDMNMFQRVMKELDLDGSGTIHKREFVNAFLKKHHDLEDQKYFIKEDIDDLELKYRVLEERVNGVNYGRIYKSYNRGVDQLKVVVVEARNLPSADAMTGSSDPYVVLHLNGQVCKTKTINVNLNPLWKESFMFMKRSTDKVLEITVYDEDAFTKDDILGMVDIDITKLRESKIYDKWFVLKEKQDSPILRRRDSSDSDVNPPPKNSKEGRKSNKDLYELTYNLPKLRLIIQYLVHAPPDYKKELEDISELLERRQIELDAVNDMIEMLEKPFAIFQIEKREKDMEHAIDKASGVGTGEGKISKRLERMSTKVSWPILLLVFTLVYMFFTLLV